MLTIHDIARDTYRAIARAYKSNSPLIDAGAIEDTPLEADSTSAIVALANGTKFRVTLELISD